MDPSRHEPPVLSPGGEGAADSEAIAALNRWVTGPMTALNRDILAGRQPAEAFPAAVTRTVAPILGVPERLPPADARRLLVLLGLVGAGLGRHFQERSAAHRTVPQQAFDIGVGEDQIGFLEFFARLAERTGAGHPPRDTYASLTRWNLPASEVWCAGTRLAGLPGDFADAGMRTYTAAADELRFFELIKLSETFERGVNDALSPLVHGGVDLLGDEAVHRLDVAALLLEGMRRLNAGFAALPPAEGLCAGHFMDVFRQFAVHWRPGDIPPSGALDPEAIERDFLLGLEPPGYREHVRRLEPGLLPAERDRLAGVMAGPGLPGPLLERCGEPAGLAGLSVARLRVLVGRFPVVAALYLVLQAHARVSGVHLLLSKKYLFTPQRERDRSGGGDPGVVSNRRGTTGMDEGALERLTRFRQRHALTPLRALGTPDLEALTGLSAMRGPDGEPPVSARFVVAHRGGELLPLRPRTPSDEGLPADARHRGGAP